MGKNDFAPISKAKTITTIFFLFLFSFSNSQTIAKNTTTDFWKQVQFGGGLGLNFGSGYTEITLAPSAVYPINDYVSLGTGLLGSFSNLKNDHTTNVYGASIISLFNPLDKIQLSLEVEQIRVKTEFQLIPHPLIRKYWDTGLYAGAGYRNGNVTLGARYNLLFDKDKSIYNDALMPFVRFYF